jgi:hypothetical protein|tara:strand:- start:241 stop:585 length:345 start_codon:yes stop_codon:yes gene_type:complete
MNHDIWLFDTDKEVFLLELPSELDGVEDCLGFGLNILQEMIQDVNEENDFHLFMENKYFKYKGVDEKAILLFASEFRIGVIVMNAEMQNSRIIGPYSTKSKTLYKSPYKNMVDC